MLVEKKWIILYCILAAPSEVAQPTIETIGDNVANITWNTPERENGILTYYKVTIFNQLRNYSQVITLSPNATKSLEFDDLGTLFYCM